MGVRGPALRLRRRQPVVLYGPNPFPVSGLSFLICETRQCISKYGSHSLCFEIPYGAYFTVQDSNKTHLESGSEPGKLYFEHAPRGSSAYRCLKPTDLKCFLAVSSRYAFFALRQLELVQDLWGARGVAGENV